MANMIPRVHPWVVTGTPVPKTGDVADMQGLFEFLDIEFTATNATQYWSGINLMPKEVLLQFLNPFVHRNTKANVAKQLILPPQTDTTYLIPFQPIENHYYQDLLEKAIKDIGPPPTKTQPISWKADKSFESLKSVRFSKMASWLLRLRQTCCHPQASADNRKVLGGRVESILDVLNTMLENNFSTILTDERKIILNVISSSQILE